MRISPIPRMVGASVAAVGQIAEQVEAVVDHPAGSLAVAGVPANDGQPIERRGLAGPEPGLPWRARGTRDSRARRPRGRPPTTRRWPPPGALGTPRGGRRARDGSRRPRRPAGRRARCRRTGWRAPRGRRAPARAPPCGVVARSRTRLSHRRPSDQVAVPQPERPEEAGRGRAPGRDPPTGSDPARPGGCRARSRDDRTSSARPAPRGRRGRPRRWPGPRSCGPTRPRARSACSTSRSRPYSRTVSSTR